MDPLSVSAAVVGLLTAGASTIDMLQNIRNMPKVAQGVISEVSSITTCLRSLQTFLNGATTAARSRTSLIMIDEVRVVLTDSLTTFSELKETLAKLGLNRQGRIADRMRWASTEKAITALLLRLQGSRTLMTLMLTTLNCHSAEVAMESSRELRELVIKALDSDERLAQRFEDVHLPKASLFAADTSTIRLDHDNDTTKQDVASDQIQNSQSMTGETMFGFTFDKDLQATRVYSRLKSRRSEISLPSSAGQSRGWSIFSGITLSRLSSTSVVSLPISAAEIYGGYQDLVCHDTIPPNRLDETIAAVLWPPERVALWFRRTDLPKTLLEDFLTENNSGFAILFLQRKHMGNHIADVHTQALLWQQVQSLQSCIVRELMEGLPPSMDHKPEIELADGEGSGVFSPGSFGVHSDRPSRTVLTTAVPTVRDIPTRTAETSISRHHAAVQGYLAQPLHDNEDTPKPNRGRLKMMRLSLVQFMELSTDICDETLRRQGAVGGGFDVTGQGDLSSSDHPRPQDNFLPKRNKARKNLAILPSHRFHALATDLCSELERRSSGFHAHKIVDSNGSPAPSARIALSRQVTVEAEGHQNPEYAADEASQRGQAQELTARACTVVDQGDRSSKEFASMEQNLGLYF